MQRGPPGRRAQGFAAGLRRRLVACASARKGVKRLNLGLQGGGAHGAFTWGVLERLLEDRRLRFEAVSGTSAGAVNAVLLAAGLLEGGRDGACAKLEAFWRGISVGFGSEPRPAGLLAAAPGASGGWAAPGLFVEMASRFLSPYQLNPLNYNPLHERLEGLVDWQRLRRESPLRLYIAATDVVDGRRRVFQTAELSADAVMASACLPHIHHVARVGNRHYWDGGYTANPALLPLVLSGAAADTLLVQLLPSADPEIPRSPRKICERVNEIVFNAHLRQEIEMIEFARRLAADAGPLAGPLHRRLRRHRFHRIDATPVTRALGPGSRLTADWRMISRLRDGGRQAAAAWLETHFDALGRRATVDLADGAFCEMPAAGGSP